MVNPSGNISARELELALREIQAGVRSTPRLDELDALLNAAVANALTDSEQRFFMDLKSRAKRRVADAPDRQMAEIVRELLDLWLQWLAPPKELR